MKLLYGTILVFIGGCLCAGGGIGGGGIYIPIFILLLGMSAHEAVPLSKVRKKTYTPADTSHLRTHTYIQTPT